MPTHPEPDMPCAASRPLRQFWLVTGMLAAVNGAAGADFLPLPGEAITPGGNPVMDMAEQAISKTGDSLNAGIPDSFVIRNDNGQVSYDSAKRTISYTAGSSPIYLRTGEGQEIFTHEMTADLNERVARLKGPLVIYQGDTLTHAEGGYYDWGKGEATITGIRAKVNGLLVRGSSIEYKKDAKGKSYMVIRDAYASTEDVEKPGMWVGTGQLTIYPGDYGTISRLSLASDTRDVPIPILGWMSISHSLNPREGYLPLPGVKSIWGAFLKNRYGILLGNRRVEHGMPVADYTATILADYRTRRGAAGGLELTDDAMSRRYRNMDGLSIYYAADSDPSINPTEIPRERVNKNRYRIAMHSLWNIPALERKSATDTRWELMTNVNAISDRYMLQDFYEDIARTNDKPDNVVSLTRRSPRSQTMLLTRFAPNDFYTTDERTEVSYYRVRSSLGNTRLAYETRSSAGIMRQFVPEEQRMAFRQMISEVHDREVREYYTRLLNTSGYARVNSTHELSCSFNVLSFLNVTPKAGGGYTGYYDVDGVGADNRFMGYLGCDFDIKLSRRFSGVRIPMLGINELYHVIHPYASISHGTISSSNNLVPKVDTWSSTLGNSTVNPMPLDLMGFTGIDGWGRWTVWRLGTQNTLSTVYDGESHTVLHWNVFIDYNVDNPNTESRFSNLYSIVNLYLSERFSIDLETQTPTVRDGDGFNQYNTSMRFLPTSWLETSLGHRYIRNHPVQENASQIHAQVNLRLNEKYTMSARVYWDLEEKRIPIQQYSVSRKFGPWYVGTTFMIRNNGNRRETGMGLSFTLGETGTSLPVNFF